jgi:hypothetical protein
MLRKQVTKIIKIKPDISPTHPPRQLVHKEEVISIAAIKIRDSFTVICFHFHRLRLRKAGITQVKYAANPFWFLKGPVTKESLRVLPRKNSYPKNFCEKTENPTNVALNKRTHDALTMRLVSRNVSTIIQRSKENLPHLIKRACMLLVINGPLLNNDKPIKMKKSRRNKNNILLDFIVVKSGDRIFLNKNNTLVIPAKVLIAAIERGIKKIIP